MIDLLPWLSLGVALSPAWLELASHVAATPEARYVLLAPLLLAWAWRRDATRAPRRADGLGVLAVAVAIELVALSSGPAALARMALPLGIVGMARWRGSPALPTALLSLWLVPLPHTVVQHWTPALESGLLSLAALPFSAAGADLHLEGPLARFGGQGSLHLAPTDGGLALAWALGLLGWFDAVRAGRGLPGAVGRACAWAALGLPVQLLALLVALGIGLGGSAEAARAVLTHGVWPVPALIATLRWTGRPSGGTRDGL